MKKTKQDQLQPQCHSKATQTIRFKWFKFEKQILHDELSFRHFIYFFRSKTGDSPIFDPVIRHKGRRI